jgi:hypothetical protein
MLVRGHPVGLAHLTGAARQGQGDNEGLGGGHLDVKLGLVDAWVDRARLPRITTSPKIGPECEPWEIMNSRLLVPFLPHQPLTGSVCVNFTEILLKCRQYRKLFNSSLLVIFPKYTYSESLIHIPLQRNYHITCRQSSRLAPSALPVCGPSRSCSRS